MNIKHLTKLNNYNTALAWKANAEKNGRYLTIMHGDDGLFWMVPGRQVKALEAQGYERA